VALDYGCGIGRMSVALAKRFERVVGVDVSRVMIRKADALQAEVSACNVEYQCTTGRDLSLMPDESCDLVLCYVVLQHIPNEATILDLLLEFARVTKREGHVVLQFPAYRPSRLVRPWRKAQSVFRRVLRRAEQLNLVRPERGTAFRGTRLDLERVQATLLSQGIQTVDVDRGPSPYRLCERIALCGRKSHPAEP
jgi:2-polyprenyl-3-methyl-5-hydroxy-6-metoxy-1,4-benzoquinol methylase